MADTEKEKHMAYAIKYKGVLTEMWVTGFSEPMDVGSGDMERSVQACSMETHAKPFDDSEIEEALALTHRYHPSAEKVELEQTLKGWE